MIDIGDFGKLPYRHLKLNTFKAEKLQSTLVKQFQCEISIANIEIS